MFMLSNGRKEDKTVRIKPDFKNLIEGTIENCYSEKRRVKDIMYFIFV